MFVNSLFAMAMNPNLTGDQFIERSKQVMDGHRRMVEQTLGRIENADVSPEVKMQMLVKVLSMIFC